jgi:nuclear transport factor 2 (NTF2) superfamily protein
VSVDKLQIFYEHSLNDQTGAPIQAVGFYQQGKTLSKRDIFAGDQMEIRPPVPPFTEETALLKVKAAEEAWNSKDPERIALAYTADSVWRNRDQFFTGREAIKQFLREKFAKELDYRLMKELWCYTGRRISVRFEYEWHDEKGQWYRSHGNEHWEFDDNGLMRRRDASINDIKIEEKDRRYR